MGLEQRQEERKTAAVLWRCTWFYMISVFRFIIIRCHHLGWVLPSILKQQPCDPLSQVACQWGLSSSFAERFSSPRLKNEARHVFKKFNKEAFVLQFQKKKNHISCSFSRVCSSCDSTWHGALKKSFHSLSTLQQIPFWRRNSKAMFYSWFHEYERGHIKRLYL